MECKKLWGGRFSADVNASLRDLNNSLAVDRRLFAEDIQGSIGYAEALAEAGILTGSELTQIESGLLLVLEHWRSGNVQFRDDDEDVHTVNERLLTERIGAVAGKLHTGRSRNDQVATDMRMWMKTAISSIVASVRDVCGVILRRSGESIDVLMPGYTHLQRAQPVRFSHWLLSYGFFLKSDLTRFRDLLKRVDCLPLGSGAIAGNPFAIDRPRLAKRLGFGNVTENSMNAVSDRDFVGNEQ